MFGPLHELYVYVLRGEVETDSQTETEIEARTDPFFIAPAWLYYTSEIEREILLLRFRP